LSGATAAAFASARSGARAWLIVRRVADQLVAGLCKGARHQYVLVADPVDALLGALDSETAQIVRRALTAAREGRLQEACDIGRNGLAAGCDEGALHAMIGALLVQSRKFEAGLPHLKAAHEARPTDLIVVRNLACALISCNRHREAIEVLTEDVCAGDPDYALLRLRGFAAQMSGQPEIAIPAYERVVVAAPGDWETWNNLGNTKEASGDIEGAIASLQRAIDLNPDAAPARLNHARILRTAGRLAEARSELRRMASDFPHDEKPLVDLADLLQNDLSDHAGAAAAMEEAAARDPSNADLLVSLGHLQLLTFAMDAAEATFRRALELERANTGAFVGLADLFEHYRPEALAGLVREAEALQIDRAALGLLKAFAAVRAKNFAAGIRALKSVPVDFEPERRWQLEGQLLDGAGLYDDAFEAFTRMNNAQAAHSSQPLLRASRLRVELRDQLRQMTSDWEQSQALPLDPAESSSPVFLLGFPRSGTTLLDTILMGHPGIRLMEEQPVMLWLEAELGGFNAMLSLNERGAYRARDRYFEIASDYAGSPDGSLLVDKSPLHTQRLPQIARLFPNAKFILALRHPADVVLSCFMTNFQTNSAMANFLTLETAAEFYDLTFTMWERSRELFPVEVHPVVYEKMVIDPEQTLRPVVEALGLAWHPGMLDHRQTGRTRGVVTTASYAQITAPLYQSAMGRWKHYRRHLEAVLPTLTPWIEKFGYTL